MYVTYHEITGDRKSYQLADNTMSVKKDNFGNDTECLRENDTFMIIVIQDFRND